jgi:hypothetical protein
MRRIGSLVCVLGVVAVLALALEAEEKFQVLSTVDAPSIAGRRVQLDARGKLLPFPMPSDTGYSYSSHVLAQWTILWDQFNRQRNHYFFCCFDFDRTTFEMQPEWHWANSTAYLRAMMQGFIERLYPYTGDQRTITFLRDFIDYELENGLTPDHYAWSKVPYASANPGALRYTGWSVHGEDYIEPHVVGEDGYAYVRFYEMTGNAKYLAAGIRCANALVKNYRLGDEGNSPWPVRCYARDGKVEGKGMGPYSANVVEPIMLFDELIRLEQGDVSSYRKIRQGAWDWLQRYPIKNNVWVGYFEDVTPSMENMNQVVPLEYARWVLLHSEKDPAWKEHARALIEWVKTTPKWPKYKVHGATVTTEQGNGETFCCNVPNQCCDSHTARLAATEAFYYAKTGDPAYKEEAYRSFNWVSYFQGLSKDAHAPFSNQWWFTDEFADGPRRIMDAFWAVPEWAPADESHLVGSLSPVTRIAYGRGSVTYSTFDTDSEDVLRLDFVPDSVAAGGRKLTRRQDLSKEGFLFDEKTRVLRIRHTSSRDIDIQGHDGRVPPLIITFDDPHLSAGTVLKGEYPSGSIDWGSGTWRIGTPSGAFGTFNLVLADPNADHAEFRFYYPRIFQGIDVYNGGPEQAVVTIRSPELREFSETLNPGELKRVKTGWRDQSSAVIFDVKNGEGLRFDNLVYTIGVSGSVADLK